MSEIGLFHMPIRNQLKTTHVNMPLVSLATGLWTSTPALQLAVKMTSLHAERFTLTGVEEVLDLETWRTKTVSNYPCTWHVYVCTYWQVLGPAALETDGLWNREVMVLDECYISSLSVNVNRTGWDGIRKRNSNLVYGFRWHVKKENWLRRHVGSVNCFSLKS